MAAYLEKHPPAGMPLRQQADDSHDLSVLGTVVVVSGPCHPLGMAVQPDKRAKEIQDREARTNLTERARAGRHVLVAMAMLPHPAVYFIRRDGSELTLGSVSRDVRGGWLTENAKTDRKHGRAASPAECLAWWLGQESP